MNSQMENGMMNKGEIIRLYVLTLLCLKDTETNSIKVVTLQLVVPSNLVSCYHFHGP